MKINLRDSFDKEPHMLRDTYCNSLIELAGSDPRIIALDADLMSSSGMKPFMKAFPERFINCGVAEANMVGIACGLSAGGKIPFAASFGCFATRRAYDQFFLSGNYARQNVKLVGTDPGISATFNGGTHTPFEDVGIMRNIPGLVVFEPCDPVSLKKLLWQSAAHPGCTYMRLYRRPANQIYSEDEAFELGKGKVLKEGNDVTLIASGVIMVQQALKAVELLSQMGISAALIDMHTIKPIDKELIVEYARKTGFIVTCENHQIVNGLGSAVAEVIAENCPVFMKRLGIEDEFGEVGTEEELLVRFRLTVADIIKAVNVWIK